MRCTILNVGTRVEGYWKEIMPNTMVIVSTDERGNAHLVLLGTIVARHEYMLVNDIYCRILY